MHLIRIIVIGIRFAAIFYEILHSCIRSDRYYHFRYEELYSKIFAPKHVHFELVKKIFFSI